MRLIKRSFSRNDQLEPRISGTGQSHMTRGRYPATGACRKIRMAIFMYFWRIRRSRSRSAPCIGTHSTCCWTGSRHSAPTFRGRFLLRWPSHCRTRARGLNDWDFEWTTDAAVLPEMMRRFIGSMPAHFINYCVGELVINSGRLMHQIAPANNIQPEDERITLQGHALFSDGC